MFTGWDHGLYQIQWNLSGKTHLNWYLCSYKKGEPDIALVGMWLSWKLHTIMLTSCSHNKAKPSHPNSSLCCCDFATCWKDSTHIHLQEWTFKWIICLYVGRWNQPSLLENIMEGTWEKITAGDEGMGRIPLGIGRMGKKLSCSHFYYVLYKCIAFCYLN